MRPAKVQFTADMVAELRTMHANGVSRNQCARHFGVGVATMTRLSRQLTPPLSWDRRPQLSAAVETRALDLKARRAQAAQDAMTRAEALIQRIHETHKIVQLGGGGEGMPSQWFTFELDQPDARSVKDLAQAASVLANLSMRLVDFDKSHDGETDNALGKLGELSGNLASVAKLFGADLPDGADDADGGQAPDVEGATGAA